MAKGLECCHPFLPVRTCCSCDEPAFFPKRLCPTPTPSRCAPAGRLDQLLDAGDWSAAHALLCDLVAPRWVLAGTLDGGPSPGCWICVAGTPFREAFQPLLAAPGAQSVQRSAQAGTSYLPITPPSTMRISLPQASWAGWLPCWTGWSRTLLTSMRRAARAPGKREAASTQLTCTSRWVLGWACAGAVAGVARAAGCLGRHAWPVSAIPAMRLPLACFLRRTASLPCCLPPSPSPLSVQELYATLGRSSSREAPAALSFPERMEAASRLAAMLQDASARWGLGGAAPEAQQPRRLDARPGGGAMQQAVYARMSGGQQAGRPRLHCSSGLLACGRPVTLHSCPASNAWPPCTPLRSRAGQMGD